MSNEQDFLKKFINKCEEATNEYIQGIQELADKSSDAFNELSEVLNLVPEMENMSEPPPYTKEEVREEILNAIRARVHYWESDPNMSKKDALEGLAHSILVLLDGHSDLPAFDLVARPHEDDMQYRIDNDERYYVDGMVVNDDVCLHELFFRK